MTGFSREQVSAQLQKGQAQEWLREALPADDVLGGYHTCAPEKGHQERNERDGGVVGGGGGNCIATSDLVWCPIAQPTTNHGKRWLRGGLCNNIVLPHRQVCTSLWVSSHSADKRESDPVLSTRLGAKLDELCEPNKTVKRTRHA